ncbi:MAG TPA: hypothetical protein VGC67_12310 [Cellulomonas sp.]
MTTPHDDGSPDAATPQPTPPSAAPVPAPPADAGARPAPQFGQYAPAGWQDPGAATGPAGPVAPTAPAGWSAPAGGAPGAPTNPWGGAPGYVGAPVPPVYGQQPGAPVPPGYGYAGTPYQQPVYQQPAYQPGIVPLRPLSVWEIFDGAFRAIRANPRAMFGLSAAVVTVVVVISSVISWYATGLVVDEASSTFSSMSQSAAYSDLFSESIGSMAGTYLTLPLRALGTTVLTGLLILSVSRSVIGRTVTIQQVVHGSGRRLLWVIGFALLSFLALLAVVGVLTALVVGVAAVTGSVTLTVLTLLAALAAWIVLALWFTIRTMLVPPALMLEGGRFWSTVGRAWRLTRASFWRLLGLSLLTQILTSVVAAVVVLPASMITSIAFDDPAGTTGSSIVVNGVASIIALTLATAFSAAVVALAYIDARMRREGLDVELARAAGGAGL